MTSATSLATTLAHTLQRLVAPSLQRSRPYALFNIELKRRLALSPSMTRFVFGGADVARIRTLAPDQRVKLFFAAADGTAPDLPCQGDWQAARRALPACSQPPMRTYTIRALRADVGELDIDFVLHGETGPASTWATHARPGDRLQIVAPAAEHAADPGGYEWQPPPGIRQVLLIGDETALPAIAGILDTYAEQADPPRVQAFIEVPCAADRLVLPEPAGSRIHWLARQTLGQQHGEPMLQAARELATLPHAPAHARSKKPLEDVDIEQDILWELARPANNAFYAWIAGESAAVMAIRKHLISERGLDRQALTFMGYWRLGRALG